MYLGNFNSKADLELPNYQVAPLVLCVSTVRNQLHVLTRANAGAR